MEEFLDKMAQNINIDVNASVNENAVIDSNANLGINPGTDTSINRNAKTKQEARMMQPLVLAYVGDAVFEVFIRSYLVNKKDGHVNEYHKECTKYVKAAAQSKIVHSLEDDLTEEEWTIVKRGRNQKSLTVPKNANITDYKYATGFEALLGYLFYIGDYKRLVRLMERATQVIEGEIKD